MPKTTRKRLQERQDAPLILTASAESFNATNDQNSRNSAVRSKSYMTKATIYYNRLPHQDFMKKIISLLVAFVMVIVSFSMVSLSTEAEETEDMESTDETFTPMGDSWLEGWHGSFDGNNYTIDGIYISKTGSDTGFFAKVTDNASITNMQLTNVSINAEENTGGLIGYATNATVSNCRVEGDVQGSSYVGGLIGKSLSATNVEKSFTKGTVTATNYGGGFIGQNSGTIHDCYTQSNVTRPSGTNTYIASFAGYNSEGNITKCYATGNITYNEANPTSKGFVGGVATGGDYYDDGNFFDNQTTGQDTTSGNAVGKNTADMKSWSTYNDAGWDIVNYSEWNGETWYIASYPHLGSEYEPSEGGVNSVSLGTPSIPNGATNVPITTKWWNISISDAFGSFNYSIETSPDIGSISETNSANGTKSCFLTSTLSEEYLHFDGDAGNRIHLGGYYHGNKQAIKLNQTDLQGYNNKYLTSVKIYANNADDVDLEIWEGGTKPDGFCCVYGGTEGTQLIQQPIEDILSEGPKWYNIPLNEPFKIDSSTHYWIVIDTHDSGEYFTVYRDNGCVSTGFDRSNWLGKVYVPTTGRTCWLDKNNWDGTDTDAWNIRAGISDDNLRYGTTYNVYVNVTGSQRNETYTFTAEDGPEDYIDITLTPNAEASILLNKTTWNPSCGIGGNESTSLSMFNLDNDGSVSVDVTINASNTSAWTLSTSTGHNLFNMSFSTGSSWMLLDTSYSAFESNLAWDESVDFGLQLYMPTSTSTNTSQQSIVTLIATPN